MIQLTQPAGTPSSAEDDDVFWASAGSTAAVHLHRATPRVSCGGGMALIHAIVVCLLVPVSVVALVAATVAGASVRVKIALLAVATFFLIYAVAIACIFFGVRIRREARPADDVTMATGAEFL